MATKVYLSGDVVVVDKLGFPPVANILVTQCKYQLIAVVEHENAEVIDYKDISIIDYVNNIVITDLVTDIQDIAGVPIGNLNEVIKYLSGFINIGDFNIVEQEQGGGGGSGEINTASNVGTGDGVFKQKTGVDLEFKTLIGGTNVSIVNNPNDLTINATGTGEVNTASNIGAGEGVFKNKVALDLVFRSLVAGTNISFVSSINELEINASGTGLNVLETATLDGIIITPPQLLADQDDYNPTGFSTCNMIRQDINGQRVITGFVAPPAGVNRIFGICNLSASSNIKFKNNDNSSAAPNRLLLRDNGPDKSIKENETAVFWYDHTNLRWRPYNRIG